MYYPGFSNSSTSEPGGLGRLVRLAGGLFVLVVAGHILVEAAAPRTERSTGTARDPSQIEHNSTGL
jgi:hypothetical protein